MHIEISYIVMHIEMVVNYSAVGFALDMKLEASEAVHVVPLEYPPRPKTLVCH